MRFLKREILYIILLIFSCSFVHGQTSTIRGFVYDKEDGEPIVYSNIYLKGTSYGASTNIDGYFNLSKVPGGDYTMIITCLGYDSLSVPLSVKSDGILTKKFYLNKSAIALEGVTVSAERQEMKTHIRTAVVKITPKQINKIPTIGSEPDLAQYLQILPGVVFTGDQGGQLYIRGGAPIHNKVLLDGMTIYNPFHSIGLFSVFDADILRNADVYTGGFNAEYGGRISSVMDITTRDGNKKRLSGKLSSSTFGSKVLLEGPLKRLSGASNGSSSFILSGKTSYLEQSSKVFYNYIDSAGLPFNFTDLYGKVSLNSVNGSKVNIFGFNFSDQVKYQAVSDLNWNSYGVGSNIVLVPSGISALIKSNISYSNYEISLKELDDRERNSYINNFNVGLEFIYFLGKDEFSYGIETVGFKTRFNFYNSIGRKITQEENTTELGAYFKYKHAFGKLLVEPGIRFQYYASLSEMSPEPRLGLKYNITDKFRFKFAGGLYSQNLISATSDRDVVSLFYGFLSGPSNLPEEFDGKEVKTRLQTARHAIVGFEYDLTKKIDVNIEGYYKQNTQITNLNRNKLFEDVPENYAKPDYLKNDFVIETGDAYGVDLLVKYDYKRLFVWFVYSLGFVNRYAQFENPEDREDENGVYENYIPHFDKRHNMNLVTSYTFGKHLNWEASARWNFGSGFPFTKTQGFYEKLPFTEGISSSYQSMNGEMGIYYGELNGGRLPYYHRLDVTIKRNIEFTNSTLQITASVTNVYDRQNIFYFDRVKYERVNQLPFMPSMGISYKF